MESNQTVSFWSSIKTRIIASVFLIIIAISVVNMAIIITNMTKTIEKNTRNYMSDLSTMSGHEIQEMADMDEKRGVDPEDSILNAGSEDLARMVGNVGMKGVDSIYAYVVAVDDNKTILYHPTKEKIGSSVENSVVSGLVTEIKGGGSPKNDVVTYKFKGETKYAGYYIGHNKDFILVVSADKSEVFKPVNKVIRLSVITAVILLILSCLVTFFITGSIINPLKTLQGMIERFTSLNFTVTESEKDITAKRDEIGVMARALIGFQKNISDIVTGIQQRSVTVLDSSDKLLEDVQSMNDGTSLVEKAVQEIAEGATSQAQETSDSSQNVTSMGNMIEASTESVNHLKELAEDMKSAMNETVEALNNLGAVNQNTSESVREVSAQTVTTNESVQKISEAVKMITSIAEETNLLSLNASIEAARAGEAGRGFAVVASQIQKLAEQSNDSASQITDIITSLIENSEKSMEIMKKVNENMDSQNADLSGALVTFDKVKASVDDSVTGIVEITGKMSDIDTLRVKVVDSVQQLMAVSEEYAASTEETLASVNQVTNASDKIKELASSLRDISNDLDGFMKQFTLG
jgi:methyl-accepting chemotaxis protein